MRNTSDLSEQDIPELVDITLIVPNRYQPRQQADPASVIDLAASVEKNGLLQPPTVRRIKDIGLVMMAGQELPLAILEQGLGYELAFGHTRLEAYKLLASQGKSDYLKMPVFVRDLTDLQIFEQAVAENIRRQDLNPVEQAAAMRRYMQDFHKSSKEAGEFFGVNDATVRGTVRLLDLPAVAREKLASGELTIGSARQLLTIQRVSGQKAAEDTAKKLAVPSVDTEHIVNQQLKTGAETVEMWSAWRSDDSPRAGNGLWLLRTPPDKLPNDLLPELTKSEAFKIFGFEGKKTGIDGAPAAYPQLLIDLNHDPTPAQNVITNTSEPSWVDLVERTVHLIDPLACTVCPFYAKVDKGHYCAFKACHERKIIAFSKAELDRLVKKLDIPAYASGSDGAEKFILKNDRNDQEKFKKLFDARTDVRLQMAYTSSQKSYGRKHDYTESWLVRAIVVGKTARKLIEKRRKEHADQSAWYDHTAQERRWRIGKQNEKASSQLFDLAAPVLSIAFIHLDEEPMRALLRGDDDFKKASAEKLRIGLAKKCLNGLTDYETRKAGPLATAKHLQGVATTWGISLPADWMDLAQGLTEGLEEYQGRDGKTVVVSIETEAV